MKQKIWLILFVVTVINKSNTEYNNFTVIYEERTERNKNVLTLSISCEMFKKKLNSRHGS
jgi:hypothetical protein